MKNILISLLVISAGFNIYLAVQNGAKQSQAPAITERSDFGIFQRESDTWVFYTVKGNGVKEATGLRVPVQSNSNVPKWPEEIYASLSSDGKRVAYMQKPAWPHQIYLSNVDGTQTREVVKWFDNNFTPAHSTIENQFTWSLDGNALLYAITNSDCGPAGSGDTFETTIFRKDFTSENEEVVLRLEYNCDERSTGARTVIVD